MKTGTTDAQQKAQGNNRPYEMPAWIRVLLLKEEIEASITSHLEIGTFGFVVPYWENTPLWRTAASQTGLNTDKLRHELSEKKETAQNAVSLRILWEACSSACAENNDFLQTKVVTLTTTDPVFGEQGPFLSVRVTPCVDMRRHSDTPISGGTLSSRFD